MSEDWTNIYSGLDEFQNTTSLTLGNPFLDKATRGIFPDEFIIIGAETGIGKTQFCVNIALKNAEKGKLVHFIALEASKNEIQKRITFNTLSKVYHADIFRPELERPLNFADFCVGKFKELYEKYEPEVLKTLETYKTLQIKYGGDDYKVGEMEMDILKIHDETDLVIIDHAHYFEVDEDHYNENRALKKIAKTARKLTQELQVPIILVAHLRKLRNRNELVPSADEFHGSSDLAKISTMAITLATGEMLDHTSQETFIRVAKNRIDSSVKKYIGKLVYNFEKGDFEGQFCLGKQQSGDKPAFKSITRDDRLWPYWMN